MVGCWDFYGQAESGGSTHYRGCKAIIGEQKKGSGVFFASAANNPEHKTRLQHEIEATDCQIDQLVFELYGLTEEEIKIVEDSERG